jgi:hypothetical protein
MVMADKSLPYLLFASSNNNVDLIIKVLNGEKLPIKYDVAAQQSMVQRNQITEANKFKSVTITTVVTSNNFSELLVEAYNIHFYGGHLSQEQTEAMKTTLQSVFKEAIKQCHFGEMTTSNQYLLRGTEHLFHKIYHDLFNLKSAEVSIKHNIQLLCNHIVKNHPKFRNEGSTLSDLVKAVLWNPLKSAYISTEGNDEAQKFFASRMKLVGDTTDNYLNLDNFSITPPRKK